MAHIKNMQNKAYISSDMKECLSRFEMYRYNFICAPTGYGKSIVCKTFYRNFSGYTVLWIDADSSKEIFWMNLCNAIKIINPSYAAAFKELGFPDTEEKANEVINKLSVMSQSRSSALVIIDNFDCILDDNIERILTSCYSTSMLDLKYIFIMRQITRQGLINLITKKDAGLVDKSDLAFTDEDILDYFKLNEIIITSETAKELYDKTLGWPIIIHSYMDNYKDKQYSDSYVYDIADSFIRNNIWLELDNDRRDFLTNMCVFNEFTLEQCVRQLEINEKDCLVYLNSTAIINYNMHTRKYSFNPVFKHFMLKVLEDKPVEDIKRIKLKAAETNLYDGNYFEAMKLFYASDNYDKIYLSSPDFKDIYPYIIKRNKNIFSEIANHYWDVEKHGKYDFSIIICFSMLLLNEKNTVQTLLADIEADINNDSDINDIQKNQYISELEYIKAFECFNDFDKMNKHFNRISAITKSPVSIIAGKYPFNFECPSIMSLYHRTSGSLEHEMCLLNDCAPDYYRITNGHGKGFEALMKAEVLYNRGEIESAEILCHKAVYMADSRNQYSIYIAANYLLALIAIHYGSNDEFKEYMSNISPSSCKSEQKDFMLVRMADICIAGIYCNIEDKDKIPEWLKDEKNIEDNVDFFSLSFINTIAAKYMIINKDYHEFLGISGQLLGLSKMFSYIIPRIYTYIYLAIANNELGDSDKARKFLHEAINLAIKDDIYMPFVHNYSYISDLLIEAGVNKNISLFVKAINKLAKTHEKGVKVIKKAGHMLANYGLTVREADVAKLAAQRLSNKEIAEQLFIAESTVKSNMKVIFNKLQINSRSELKNFFE